VGFKVFEKASAPAKSVPTITVQKRGLFSLSRPVFERLGNPEAIELLWDEDRKAIALRPASITAPNAYSPRESTPGKGPLILAGSAFTQYIDLDTTQARRWVAKFEDGMAVIDTTEEPQIVTSNRERGEQRRREEADADVEETVNTPDDSA